MAKLRFPVLKKKPQASIYREIIVNIIFIILNSNGNYPQFSRNSHLSQKHRFREMLVCMFPIKCLKFLLEIYLSVEFRVMNIISITMFWSRYFLPEKLQMKLRSEGGLRALVGMVRCGHADVLSQIARGVANFAKCESRAANHGTCPILIMVM